MPTGLEPTVTGEQSRTLPVAATGTALSPAFTTPIATLTSTATSLSSGPEGQVSYVRPCTEFQTTHPKGTRHDYTSWPSAS